MGNCNLQSLLRNHLKETSNDPKSTHLCELQMGPISTHLRLN